MDATHATHLLEAERSRIVEALRGLVLEPGAEPLTSTRTGDEGAETAEAELDEGLADGLRADLAAVDRAEARLAAGEYGLSVESGEPIPDERLEVHPTAERTAAEQERFEHGPGGRSR